MNISTLFTPGWVRPPSLALCADECGAKCCRNRLVLLSPEEAARLTPHPLRPPISRGADGRWAMLAIPACRFLGGGNRCTIYAERPDACHAFPQRPSAGCLVWPKDA